MQTHDTSPAGEQLSEIILSFDFILGFTLLLTGQLLLRGYHPLYLTYFSILGFTPLLTGQERGEDEFVELLHGPGAHEIEELGRVVVCLEGGVERRHQDERLEGWLGES